MRVRYEVFGTKSDWVPGLSKIKDQFQPIFAERGLFVSQELRAFSSLLELPDLGISRFGSHPTERTFFIVPKDTSIRMRPIPQSDGSVRYSVGQGDNRVCVFFCPGGIFHNECLISGLVASMGESKETKDFFSHISSALLDGFQQVKEYHVGPAAMQLLNSGFRLTNNHRKPLIDDLKK